MGMHLDEPVAAMAAAAFSIAGGVIGAWWQRRRLSGRRDVEVQPMDARALDARLERLEQLAEISAIEIERIAEGQRFTTKVLVERGEPAKSATPPRRNTDPPRAVTPH